jgi:hypothetical protein
VAASKSRGDNMRIGTTNYRTHRQRGERVAASAIHAQIKHNRSIKGGEEGTNRQKDKEKTKGKTKDDRTNV